MMKQIDEVEGRINRIVTEADVRSLLSNFSGYVSVGMLKNVKSS